MSVSRNVLWRIRMNRMQVTVCLEMSEAFCCFFDAQWEWREEKKVYWCDAEADDIVMLMQCCNEEMKGLRRRNRNDWSSSPDNFRRNKSLLHDSSWMKYTSVEEVGRRGKRGDGKVSVLIYLVVIHGQAVDQWEGTGDDRRQGPSVTGFIKKESREGGFGKAHANVQ